MFVQLDEDPVQAPDHEYVYEPVPPVGLAVNVEEFPVVMELGLAEHETANEAVPQHVEQPVPDPDVDEENEVEVEVDVAADTFCIETNIDKATTANITDKALNMKLCLFCVFLFIFF